jgi:hypothetical protein
MSLIQISKTVIVFMALLAPGFTFLITGPVDSFEQTKQVDFPSLRSVLLPAPESREQLADAIFQRSAAKRWAIQFINATNLYVLGYAETKQVVSGSDEWLFYKPLFQLWGCENHENLQLKLDRFSFLMELITSADIPLIFAHVPNKATIEREFLYGRSARYRDCYFKFEERFAEAVFGLSTHHFVDHTKVLTHEPEGPHSYLQYDTHWTQEYGLHALNQLFESRPGILGVPLYNPKLDDAPEHMGILDNLLLLSKDRTIPTPVSSKLTQKEARSANLASNVLYIHDSFYNRVRKYLLDRSPNAILQHSRGGLDQEVRLKLEQADIVVVQIVQRLFLDYIWKESAFGWGGVFAEWLLDEMTIASRQCDWSKSSDQLDIPYDSDLTTSQLILRVPENTGPGRVCLRLQLEVDSPGYARLFFSAPEATKARPMYSSARMVSKNLIRGENVLGLILPESYKGRWIRLEPVDKDNEFTIKKLKFSPID